MSEQQKDLGTPVGRGQCKGCDAAISVHHANGYCASCDESCMPSDIASDGVAAIAAERRRQITEKGWSAEHDSQHTDESLVWAAMHYACPVDPFSKYWPDTWGDQWDQRDSDDRITQLAKAGALIAAEIDRLQRLTHAGGVPE